MLAGAAVLHVIAHLGPMGRRITDILARAPALDLVITYFTVAPWFIGWFSMGAVGLLGAIIGQVVAFAIWTMLHELANLKHVRGPRIIKVLNRMVGRPRNHAALVVTTFGVPTFWIVRFTQYLVYPALVRLVGLPPYKASEWVNVSRHKFEGLVGYDLAWCLYCDWMTGIWSLGSEMLRNVESLWCPIRFDSDKKCKNCVIDFPDIATHWVNADGSMADVEALITKHYPPRDEQSEKGADGRGGKWRPWYGNFIRLTVDGNEPEPTTPPAQDDS